MTTSLNKIPQHVKLIIGIVLAVIILKIVKTIVLYTIPAEVLVSEIPRISTNALNVTGNIFPYILIALVIGSVFKIKGLVNLSVITLLICGGILAALLVFAII